jgi:hypothetical protein
MPAVFFATAYCDAAALFVGLALSRSTYLDYIILVCPFPFLDEI